MNFYFCGSIVFSTGGSPILDFVPPYLVYDVEVEGRTTGSADDLRRQQQVRSIYSYFDLISFFLFENSNFIF